MASHAWFRSPAPRTRARGSPRASVAGVQVCSTCGSLGGETIEGREQWTLSFVASFWLPGDDLARSQQENRASCRLLAPPRRGWPVSGSGRAGHGGNYSTVPFRCSHNEESSINLPWFNQLEGGGKRIRGGGQKRRVISPPDGVAWRASSGHSSFQPRLRRARGSRFR